MALGSAILVITRRNAVHCAMWLVVTLFSVGGIFLTLHAEFLFAVQVILYVGGIMVLFLFVIMLVNLDVAAKQMQFSRQWLLGLATVVGVLLTDSLGFLSLHGLALSAGVTIYVAASNLVPEFQHKRGWTLPASFFAGAAVFYATKVLLDGVS